MKKINRDTHEAMKKTHPLEAAVWQGWVENGEARIVESLVSRRGETA